MNVKFSLLTFQIQAPTETPKSPRRKVKPRGKSAASTSKKSELSEAPETSVSHRTNLELVKLLPWLFFSIAKNFRSPEE